MGRLSPLDFEATTELKKEKGFPNSRFKKALWIFKKKKRPVFVIKD